ncbi:MAG TPA: hypothetical protein VFV87_07615, partial [Pirellulaceae bacterium]|nr:hypothetical protein [Pirellulaceae bacterium]
SPGAYPLESWPVVPSSFRINTENSADELAIEPIRRLSAPVPGTSVAVFSQTNDSVRGKPPTTAENEQSAADSPPRRRCAPAQNSSAHCSFSRIYNAPVRAALLQKIAPANA